MLDILDEEVQRLPAAQQSPFVLCCLEGRTQEEAAHPRAAPGSVKGRLERGRRRLQMRLARRGFALSAALALVAVSRSAAATALLQRSAVRAALGGAAGNSVAALAESVLKGMVLSKLATLSAVVMTVAFAVSAAVALSYRSLAVEAPQDKTPADSAKAAEKPAPAAHVDALGDLLPAGAIARLGTVRFRHGGHISLVRFTPDGKRLVSQGADGVRVWDAATRKELRHHAPEPGTLWGATDLSPDGKRLAVATEILDGPFRLWELDSGKKTGPLGRGNYPLVRFSPDGKLLAAFSFHSGVELWEVVSLRRLRSWKAHGRNQVMALAFSADSRKLLTSDHGKLRLWDVATGEQLREFTRFDSKLGPPIFSFQEEALSPDGNRVAIIESNENCTPRPEGVKWTARISLRDTTTGKQVRQLTCPTQETFPGQAPTFSALTFTADGKHLLTGGPDRFLRVWDSATGEELHQWPLEFGRPDSLILSRDDKTLAAVMRDGKAIQLLNPASGKTLTSSSGHLAQVYLTVLTPDGRTAVTGGADGALLLWDVAAGRLRRRLEGHKDSVFALQLARDGRTLFSGGWDKTVRVWDLVSGEERRQIKLDRDFLPAWFDALALSPDGETLAVLSSTKTIRLLESATGKERRHFKGPEWIVGSAITPDSRSLVVWSGDLKVRIWDARTGLQRREYPMPQDLRIGQPFVSAGGGRGPAPIFYHAALSPNGRLLAIGNDRHALPLAKCFLVLKDLATGRDVRHLDELPSDVHILTFSPDGRTLAWSGSKAQSIHLLEVASGRDAPSPQRTPWSGDVARVLRRRPTADLRL